MKIVKYRTRPQDWSYCLLCFIFFAASSAHAGGYGGAWGKNRAGQTIHIYDQIYTFRAGKAGGRNDSPLSTVPFEGECNWEGGSAVLEPTHLDCSQGTASPLAGAYYQIRYSKEHRTECHRGAKIYQCKLGCAPKRIPLVFVEEEEEC